ncbi:MAG: Holliday junction resolvase RuvX [Eubacterium sp.]|nr:Holliday junction resolvase RuvX [Eubacterium sp.]
MSGGSTAENKGSGVQRILGLDYGAKTVGVAVSDPLGYTAQGLEIIRRQRESKLRQTLARIDEVIAQYQIGTIVLGLPKQMNNETGERAEKTLAFRDMLQNRTHLPVVLEDERLTTVEAIRAMNEMNLHGQDRKEVVDEIAAVFILQTYLDRLAFKAEEESEN